MNHRDERLGSAPLGKLMFSVAVPSVAAQLINVLYNIVDRMYIGHIPGYGNVALTGVGVTGSGTDPWQFGRTADPFFCDSDGVLFDM